ncbi:hypothetical protein [Mucilaginibacter arboris]|uniref:Uncharacterized protein n=1 Tax=Mucilaginibacter arboris TaxID=2682090 RepID=A0A7K1SXH0_9SPHI|nr:hypothetical protein [Mucilaginibacter arboris]MVN22003.1 hypothetical protein [Mucilaginibacter arboris]
MQSLLFKTALKRPNGEIVPGSIFTCDNGAFEFKAANDPSYHFIIKKNEKSNWYWLDGSSISIDRMIELGEKIDDYLKL